jgi:hypothetical protein
LNGINTTYLLAALLLIAGILGFVAAGDAEGSFVRLGGVALIAIALAVSIGEAIGQARHSRQAQSRDSEAD